MATLKTGWLVAGTLVIALGAVVVLVYTRFRRDMRSAQERVQSGANQVIETDCGPIEYATLGEGSPVLVVHGIFGGFDQGLVIARGNVGEAFHSVVPSRFGYLRSPLLEDASPAGQADAFAACSTLWASRNPRSWALPPGRPPPFSLPCAIRTVVRRWCYSRQPPLGETKAALRPEPLAKVMFKSDLLFWLMTTYFRSSLKSMMGVPKGFELTPGYTADVAQVMRTILPVKPRADGAVFDMFVSNADINAGSPAGYPLEENAVPVLIISAVDDPLTLYVNARAVAETIPRRKVGQHQRRRTHAAGAQGENRGGDSGVIAGARLKWTLAALRKDG